MTDGYSINYRFFDFEEAAQTELKKQYTSYIPEEWIKEFEELSYCNGSDAILYENDLNVYVWEIIPLINTF